MLSLSLGAWIFLTTALAVVVGVSAWLVSQGDLSGTVLWGTLSALLTAVVGVVFHSAGATAALATPAAPAAPAPAAVVARPAPVAQAVPGA